MSDNHKIGDLIKGREITDKMHIRRCGYDLTAPAAENVYLGNALYADDLFEIVKFELTRDELLRDPRLSDDPATALKAVMAEHNLTIWAEGGLIIGREGEKGNLLIVHENTFTAFNINTEGE